MPTAALGISMLPDPRAAGEAAALEALAACEDARYLLAFCRDGLGEVMAGVRELAGGQPLVTGCATPHLEGATALVVAIAGDGFLLRPAQRPAGPIDAAALVAEWGAPREQRAWLMFTAASDPGPISDLPGHTIAASATAIEGELEVGGTLAWLLCGTWPIAGCLDFGAGSLRMPT
jgi:hypothetical protein